MILLNIASLFCNQFILTIPAGDGNLSDAWHNTSKIFALVSLKPEIVWYDFQYWTYSNGWESRLNQQIGVNNSARYRFVVNITSYTGWDDIQYINISAWHDLGDDSSFYNQTLGGNINMKFVYDNTSNITANFSMLWPREEVRFVNYSETTVDSKFTNFPFAESKKIIFEFIPNYQFRYAPGPSNGWDTRSYDGIYTDMTFINNPWSWNFNISAKNWGKSNQGIPKTSWVADEFGTYKYLEIASAQDPFIFGEPTNEYYSVNDKDGSGNVTIVTRSNGNYSLSSNLLDLIHVEYSGNYISNESVSVRGGNREVFKNFSKSSNDPPVFLYGGGYDGMPNYQAAENNGTSLETSNVEYRCYIPIGQIPGEYKTTLYYYLKTT